MGAVYTYILKLSDGTHYTGITDNIVRRLKQHRMGESKSTVGKRPVKLIWLNESKDRKEARRIEVKIKSIGARRFMKTYQTGNWGQLMIKPLNENLDLFVKWNEEEEEEKRSTGSQKEMISKAKERELKESE